MGTDSLYYIMDYSGNYYRTNQEDQLVAVVREQDAEIYTFAQANSRIGVGKKAAFYCVIPIEDGAEGIECNFTPANAGEDRDIQEEMENPASEEYISPVKEIR